MKKLALLALAALSTQVMAQSSDIKLINHEVVKAEIKILELDSVGGDLKIAVKSTNTVKKKGKLLRKGLAKLAAKTNAKWDAQDAIFDYCKYGSYADKDIQYSAKSCLDDGDVTTCTITAEVRCTTQFEDEVIRAQVLNGLKSASTGCIDIISQSYQNNNDIVNACNLLKTVEHFECADLLAKYSKLDVAALKSCSLVGSNGLNVLKTYRERGFERPNSSIVLIAAAANTDAEATCVNNKLSLSSISPRDVEKSCLQDKDGDLDKREFDLLGYNVSARTLKYRLKN